MSEKKRVEVPFTPNSKYNITRRELESKLSVEIMCGPLPMHPPGRPGNAPRHGVKA